MIDRNRIDRHYIVKKNKEVTSVLEANTSNFHDEEVLYNALEFSSFEIIREVNVLFEGWRDKRLFEIASRGTSREARRLAKWAKQIGACHAQGVKDIAKVSSLLEMAKRKWIVISDGDRPAREHQQSYSWKGRWYRYDELVSGENVVTSEDFVDSKGVAKAFRAVCKRHSVDITFNGNLPDVGKLLEIERLLKKAGISSGVVRPILNDLKDELLESIDPSDIRQVYYAAMDEVAQMFLRNGDECVTAEKL